MINELKEVIKHHTHSITDENGNKWKVLELSDVENIIDDNENEFNNVDLAIVRELLISYDMKVNRMLGSSIEQQKNWSIKNVEEYISNL